MFQNHTNLQHRREFLPDCLKVQLEIGLFSKSGVSLMYSRPLSYKQSQLYTRFPITPYSNMALLSIESEPSHHLVLS